MSSLLDGAGLRHCHTDAAHLVTAAGTMCHAAGTWRLAEFVRHSGAPAFSAGAVAAYSSKLYCPGLQQDPGRAGMDWHALWCTAPPDAACAAMQYHSLIAAPGTNYIETLRVQIHANCRIRRIYFSDRLYRCAAFHPPCWGTLDVLHLPCWPLGSLPCTCVCLHVL